MERQLDTAAPSAGEQALLQVLADAVEDFVVEARDPQRVAERISERVSRLLRASCVTYLLSDDAKDWSFTSRAGYGSSSPDSSPWSGWAPLVHDDPAVRQALKLGQPMAAPSSSLVVPVRSSRRSFGVLQLRRPEPEHVGLSEADVLLARHLALAAALALEQGRSRDERAQEANRLESKLLPNMSHELRTPLNAIIGFSSLLHAGRAGQLTETQVEYLGDILLSARHLLQLINDVLDLARVEAGNTELQIEAVDVSRVAFEVRDIVRGLAAEKQLALVIHVAPELEVTADVALLKQILYNYLSNAIQLAADRGTIQLRIGPATSTSFKIEVEDAGKGSLFTAELPLAATASERARPHGD